MSEIVTLIVIPIIIVVFGLLVEYWVIQPLRKKNASRLIDDIKEVQYIHPHRGDLRLPANHVMVISSLGTNIYDLSAITKPIKFASLVPAFIHKAGFKDESHYHLYENWKCIEPDESFSPYRSKSPIFVLSQYPCYELLEASEALQGELINTVPHKPPLDNREARLEYDYRTIINLDNSSRKVKLANVKNDKAFYRLSFRCKSIKDMAENGEIVLNDHCEAEIIIPDGYPTEHPLIRITSKVLHPNISHGSVAFRDCYEWLSGDYQKDKLSLASMCLMTIEMLEYHRFSLTNVFNLDAAKKFKFMKSIIPLDTSNLKGY